MRFLSWWRERHSNGPAGNRVRRFRKVLAAAQGVPVYEACLREAQLDTPQKLKAVNDVETVLAKLSVFSLEQVRIRPPRTLDSPLAIRSPLPLATRLDVRWNSAGCALLQLAPSSAPDYRALFIRTGVDEGLMTPGERDALWQRYGVPMFEHLVGMDGQLLAWECETHSGLHVVEENSAIEIVESELLLTSLTDVVQPTIQTRTGWAARIETEVCDCGRPGRRLLGLEVLPAKVQQMKPETLVAAARA